MSDKDIIELIAQLRAMSRCEHEDMTVASDAADAMHEMLFRIATLEKALQPLADMWLYPDDLGADMAADIRKDVYWDETTNDEADCAEGIRRGHIRAARFAIKGVRSDALAGGDALREEITRLRAGLQRIVEGDGFWEAPSIARDLLEGKEL